MKEISNTDHSHSDFLRMEIKKLSDFCLTHDVIYLYGAGTYGKAYLQVLQNLGYHPAGFIITKGGKGFEEGYPIYPLEEIRENLKESTGIIPAFSGANLKVLQDLIGISIDILDIEAEVAGALENKRIFEPIVNSLNRKHPSYPVPPKKDWNNILVIRLDVIGDLIMTIPFLRELRRNFRGSHITLVVHEQNYELMKGCPYVSEIVCYRCPIQEGDSVFNLCKHMKDTMERVNQFVLNNLPWIPYDVVLLPRELLYGRNAMDEFLLSFYCNAICRIGRIHTKSVEQDVIYRIMKKGFSFIDGQFEFTHEIQHMLELLKSIDCHVEDDNLEVWTTDKDDEYAKNTLREIADRDRGVLVAVGLVSKEPAQSWGVDRYAQLLECGQKKYGKRMRFVLLGGTDAVEAGDVLTEQSSDNVLNLTGKTALLQAAAVLKHCDIYIGSNTGLIHFASAYGIPIVEISSMLPDVKNAKTLNGSHMGPWNVSHITLSPSQGLDGCQFFCRVHYPHCIRRITEMEVMEAIKKLIPSKMRDLR